MKTRKTTSHSATSPESRAFDHYISIGDPKSGIFEQFSPGVKSKHDEIAYDFARGPLSERARKFFDAHNHKAGHGHDVKFSEASVRTCLYRPFTRRFVYFDDVLIDQPGIFRFVFPTPKAERENLAIYCTSHPQSSFAAQVTDCVAHESAGGRPGNAFPFFLYDQDGSNRRENITDWALDEFRNRYKDPVISKWSIFDYVYGLLHHPAYCAKFAENLKRELPRIPFAPDFRSFQRAGQGLIRLHLDYERLEPWDLKRMSAPGVPLSYRVQKMKLSKDKTALIVNSSLTLSGIPTDAFEYRVGDRSALDWVIDQYQLHESPRNCMVNDPNREDDPEYIARLVGQVVRVSMETVKIAKGLPGEFAKAAAK